MEDVLEQLVGEIWDDTDEVEEEIVERPDGQYELDGDMVISDFLELVGIKEKDFEADSETVGGWTIEMFGAFPKVGDSFTVHVSDTYSYTAVIRSITKAEDDGSAPLLEY